MLHITDDEMKELDTIITKDLKEIRHNNKRKEKRRTENGLTKKQFEKNNRLEEVQKLFEQGYKQVEIAEKLNLHKRVISRDLKEIKSKKNSENFKEERTVQT